MQSKNLIVLVLAVFFALFFMGLAPGAEQQEEFQRVLPSAKRGP